MGIKIDDLELREYFAGQALAGIMANSHDDFVLMNNEQIAQLSYRMADAMIKERENK